jgi:hypothetical protein
VILRYTVSPVLNKTCNGKGKRGSYSLTEDAERRCRLELPICKVDSERKCVSIAIYVR